MARLDVPTLIVSDAAAFRAWLDANRDGSEGVWLVLAKKGMTDPTSLTYAQALEEALCQGWIDGQKRSRDATTFAQRFTPRRRTSQWSKRNLRIAEELIAEGRMLPAGLAEIDQAARPMAAGPLRIRDRQRRRFRRISRPHCRPTRLRRRCSPT